MTFIAQTGFTVTYSFSCAVPGCDEHAATLMELHQGDTLPFPCTPEGWRALQGSAVCPHHHVVVDDLSGEEAMFMAETDSHWRKAGDEE